MTKKQAIIDFAELVSDIPGQGLEDLVRHLGAWKGLSPSWSGRGADGGRDLYFTEILKGPLSTERTKWLVSCKDRARGRASVREVDLPATGIQDKLRQHGANGFLLVTTTTVSVAAKDLLDKLDKSEGGPVRTLVWDNTELTAMLLQPENEHLVKQFLPASYGRLQELSRSNDVLLPLRGLVPDSVITQIEKLVAPYANDKSEAIADGGAIWPYDKASADAIDGVLHSLLVEDDVNEAALKTEEIEFDAFHALLEYLLPRRHDACLAYLFAVIEENPDPDIKYNAARFLFDNFELSPVQSIKTAKHLDGDALYELYGTEVSAYVVRELTHGGVSFDDDDSGDYLLWISDVHRATIDNIAFHSGGNREGIAFSGTMNLEITIADLSSTRKQSNRRGTFTGYLDAQGIYLEDAKVDEN